MADFAQPVPPLKIRVWRYLPVLIILGLAVHLLIPQITTLENSWSVVTGMIWSAAALAIVMQIFSYLGSGFTLHAILATNQQKLSILKGSLITMGAASLGLVAGGWPGEAAATFGWIKRETNDGNTATLCITLPAMFNNGFLGVVAIFGCIYLLVIHDLSQMQLIEFGLVMVLIFISTFGIVAALQSPEMATKLAIRLTGGWAKLRHRRFEPQGTIDLVTEFVNAWHSLGDGKWRVPLLGGIANIGFDILTIYCLFIASGYDVSPGILLAGYGLPFIVGKIAFLFPGGVGVMEVTMVAMYDSLQVPKEISVVVILGYRLLSFWLPILLGFAAAAFLTRSQRNANSAPPMT